MLKAIGGSAGKGLFSATKDPKYVLQDESLYEPCFLAHLSRRLIGELIVYQCSGVRRRRRRRRRPPQFQTSSSPKPLGRSKPNFMWSLLG